MFCLNILIANHRLIKAYRNTFLYFTKPIQDYQSQFESFKNRDIDLPKTFFDKFLDDERAIEFED